MERVGEKHGFRRRIKGSHCRFDRSDPVFLAARKHDGAQHDRQVHHRPNDVLEFSSSSNIDVDAKTLTLFDTLNHTTTDDVNFWRTGCPFDRVKVPTTDVETLFGARRYVLTFAAIDATTLTKVTKVTQKQDEDDLRRPKVPWKRH